MNPDVHRPITDSRLNTHDHDTPDATNPDVRTGSTDLPDDVDHVDLEAGTLFLPSSIQKGSPPPATLELERDTVRTLRRYLRDRWRESPALFPTRSSDRMITRSLRRLVEKLAEAADVRPRLASGGTGDLDDATPRTLRHSVAYLIIQIDGGRLEDVQLRLRHANRQTTDHIYSHLVPR